MYRTFELILILIIVMLTGHAFASTFTTATGQGYFSWNGQVISYYSFAPGSTLNLVNGVTATDTSGTPNEAINTAAMNFYVCNMSPKDPGC